ncbi:MAG TPA: GDP-mannose 4,6-dehydratase, partial [Polyangiaceae bacterium]|nr:GDP-mannose 4,6-dehydratase [Polyangiaceae bacterium]
LMAKRVVLLTGAAGFIGSHTAELLLARGDQVVGLDNFNDYYSPQLKRKNAADLATYPNFELVSGDVRDARLIASLFARYRFNSVIHLAAMAGVRSSVEDPKLYFDVNVDGTLHLLEAARKNGNPHFVFASTSSAYGRTERIPFVETDRADAPLAPYPASKRSAELLGHSYHHIYGQNFTALRFFTVYGPRNRPDMLAHLAVDACYGKGQLALYEQGQMWRDWTYVTDIAQGVVKASDVRLGYEVINIGRGSPILLKDFVEKVAQECGQPLTWRSRSMPNADMAKTWANIDKARRLLGYEPQVAPDEGIRNLVAWYRRYYGV